MEPASAFHLICFHTPEAGSHSLKNKLELIQFGKDATYIIEQRITLSEIDNVNTDHFLEILGIPNSEIKPLQIRASIGIISHPDVVFNGGELAHLVDVAALEFTVEQDVIHLVHINFIGALRDAFGLVGPGIFHEPLNFPSGVWQMVLVTFTVYQFLVARPTDLIKFNMLLSGVAFVAASAEPAFISLLLLP